MESRFGLSSVSNILSSFVRKPAPKAKPQNTFSKLNVTIPDHTLYRTELLCSHIAKDLDLDFGLAHFLMATYTNFIEDYISNYDPRKAFNTLSREYNQSITSSISIGAHQEVTVQKHHPETTISISFAKSELKKISYVLKELEALYGFELTCDEFISQVWLSSMDEYKNLSTKKSCEKFIKSIKTSFN